MKTARTFALGKCETKIASWFCISSKFQSEGENKNTYSLVLIIIAQGSLPGSMFPTNEINEPHEYSKTFSGIFAKSFSKMFEKEGFTFQLKWINAGVASWLGINDCEEYNANYSCVGKQFAAFISRWDFPTLCSLFTYLAILSSGHVFMMFLIYSMQLSFIN